jgi:hypothetical protein
MGYSTSTIILAVAAATLLWMLHLIISSAIRRRQYKLPAQVPGIPIFGNSFQMPLTQVEQAPWAQKLAQKYGEM